MANKLETDPVIMINGRNSQTTTREKYISLKLTNLLLPSLALKFGESKLNILNRVLFIILNRQFVFCS